MNGRRHALIVGGLTVLGGGALLASAFTRWITRGPGQGLRGHHLVDAIVGLGDAVPGLSGGRLAVLWYLVPACGALNWIVYGLAKPGGRSTRAVAGVTVLVVGLVLAAFVRAVGVRALGPGAALALAGAVALVVGAWLPTPRATQAATTAAKRNDPEEPAAVA